MTTVPPVFHLLPPQKIADSKQLAPLQYTIDDTARLLALSRRMIYKLIATGELESVGTGRLRRIPYDSILAYLHRHRNEG
jgi:excisionase family DNA binding protein